MTLTVEQLNEWKQLDKEVRSTVNKFEEEFIEYFREIVIELMNIDIGAHLEFRYISNSFIYYTRSDGSDIVIPIECITTDNWKELLYTHVREIANAKTWDRLSLPMYYFRPNSFIFNDL